ncbi:MAG: hypothetical protein PHW07_05220 [Sulfurospirillaceae bacterium]|nr:hypothetical protein [Sulfurospirillaceae bacterium]
MTNSRKVVLVFVGLLMIFSIQGCAPSSSLESKNPISAQGKYIQEQQNKPSIKPKKDESKEDVSYRAQSIAGKASADDFKIVYSSKAEIVKGIVTSLAYDGKKGVWEYAVKGEDTTNNKVPFGKFVSSKILAQEGDLVYAIFSKGILVELIMIQEGNKGKNKKTNQYSKSPKHKVSMSTSNTSHKRDKSRQTPWIGVPETESIRLGIR